MTPAERIGNVLYALRAFRRLTQAEAETRTGLEERRIRQIERGTVDARWSEIVKLCDAYQIGWSVVEPLLGVPDLPLPP